MLSPSPRTLTLNRAQTTAKKPTPTAAISLFATFLLAALALFTSSAPAQNARFDLTGPSIEMRVSRNGMTLPIASVPNLQPGDRIWIHPDLPPTQSVHYLIVLAFLRGTTNPPPDNWFVRIESWDKKVRAEGTEVSVPEEAQQAVLFLAPVTGGDFTTLRAAVQGRPGIFVRAAQDLDLAGFEQARIEKYIASMREVPQAELSDPKALQEHSNLIAGILALKPNGDCVKLAPDQQYTCLTQSGNQNLLDDAHAQSLVSALSSGASSDFINAASATSLAGGGAYSAYVGAIVDLVRLMGTLHTAQYQYIPAIAFPEEAALNLRLNAAPSFRNPKSVIVIGLPAIQKTAAPPLRPTDPRLVSCLLKPDLTLPVEGAPLVYSTSFAHDLVLHINYPAGQNPAPADPQDIPLTPDAYKGGLLLTHAPDRKPLPVTTVTLPPTPAEPAKASSPSKPSAPSATPHSQDAPGSAELTGTIRGYWGFDTFQGPTMPLQRTPGRDWKATSPEPLIAGHDGHVLLTSTGTACIDTVTLDPTPGRHVDQPWKPADKPNDKPNTVDVALKLSEMPGNDPRTLELAIHQFGTPDVAAVSLLSYSEPAKLAGLEYHAGDTSAVLSGTSLDQVQQLRLGSTTFTPAGQGSSAPESALKLSLATGAAVPSAPAGDKLTADVTLHDGRVLNLPLTVSPARPAVQLISKAAVPDTKGTTAVHIALGSQDDLPLDNALMFGLKSSRPFPRDAHLEIASPDNSLHTKLSVEASTLILEDPTTVLGKLEPLNAFGASAFGPIRVRAVAPDGSAGDWIPLATLVRLPVITAVNCPVAAPATSAPVAPAAPPPSSAESPQPAPEASETPSPAANANPAPAAPPTCTLTGSSLFLVDSISADPSFTSPTPVPQGFVQDSLTVPSPASGRLYLRLRDDPAAVDTVDLPGTAPPSPKP